MATHLHSTDTPVESDVPVWVTDHWEYQPAAVITANGVGGDGTAATPIVAETSGVWGTAPLDAFRTAPSTDGQPIYVDTAGDLRSQPLYISVSLDAAAPITAYPPGVSYMGAATAGGWPAPDGVLISGSVMTTRGLPSASAGHMGFQIWSLNNGAGGRGAQIRQSSTDGWSAWWPFAGPGVPWKRAAGVATMPAVPANGGVGLAVTFPISRFTLPPVLTLGAVSNGYGAASASTPTATGFTAKYYNPTANVPGGSQIHWVATQMTPEAAVGEDPVTQEALMLATVTCRTDGCGNEDQPIDVDVAGPDGETLAVVCGVCSQPITEVVT